MARSRESKKRKTDKPYTVGQLKHDIAEATKVKASYVREAKTKENRFLTLLSGVNAIWKDGALVKILGDEKLDQRPELSGDFAYDS